MIQRALTLSLEETQHLALAYTTLYNVLSSMSYSLQNLPPFAWHVEDLVPDRTMLQAIHYWRATLKGEQYDPQNYGDDMEEEGEA